MFQKFKALLNKINVDVVTTDCRLITAREIIDLIAWETLNSHIRRVADDGVEATCAHDGGKLLGEAHGVELQFFRPVK